MARLNNQKRTLLESFKAENFLETVCANALVDRDERDGLALDLAALHNEGKIDVVSAFENLKNEPSQKIDFFLTRHVLEKALPYLSAPVPSIIRCVLHLYREAGRDMAAGTILKSFVDFCAKEPSRPSEALKEIEANPDQFADLLVPVISAGSCLDSPHYLAEAIRLCEDKNIELRRRAVFSLGKLTWQEGCLIPDSAFAALERTATAESDDLILAAGVKSAFALLQQDKTQEDRAVALITNALSKGGENTLHAAAEVFGFYTDEIPISLLDVLLVHLMRVKPTNLGTLDNIDHGIANLLKKSDPERAIRFLEDILLTHPDELTLKTFDSVTGEIRSSRPLLSKVLTRWFLRGDQVLCDGIRVTVGTHLNDNLTLEIDPAELKPMDLEHIFFLARKAIGYLFLQPVTVASLLISLMKQTEDDEILKHLGALLFDPLLLNYPGATHKYVEQRSNLETGKVKQTIEGSIKAIDDYLNTLQSVGPLPALHPSEAQRETYYRRFSRTMAESFKAAEAQSVLLNLFPKSVLLYGRKSIDYVYSDDGPHHRMETDLKSHRTEFEYPRLEHIDPYGLDYMLRVFRMERLRA